MDKVLVIGTAYNTTRSFDRDLNSQATKDAMIAVKKDKISSMWVRSGERAHYAKDLVE
jgi:hypothetical protein